MLNSELLLLIERTPDTTLLLVSGQRIMVQETPDEIVERIVDYRRRIGMPEAFWNPNFADEASQSERLAELVDAGAEGASGLTDQEGEA